MNTNPALEAAIKEYLAKIRANLGSMEADEIDEILDNVRDHIETELEQRGGEPASIHAILAEMDPPESYSLQANATEEMMPSEQISRKAIFGAIALPFGFLLILLFLPVSVQIVESVNESAISTTQPSPWQWIARFTVLPAGIIAPFLATVLGLVAISEIRGSKGRIIGLPLAVFDSLFYPLLVLDGLLFIVATALFGLKPWWSIAASITVLLMLLLDYLIIRQVWKTVSQTKSTI